MIWPAYLISWTSVVVDPSVSAASMSAAAAGALRFLSAAIDQGMGSFHLAPGFSLVLPAGSTGSIYSAAVLLDIATGP